MTTMDYDPTIRQLLARRIAGTARPRSMQAKMEFRNAVARITAYVLNVLMQLAGFGCLTLAAFTWTITAGLIAAGVSFLILSWLLTKPQSVPQNEANRPPMR